MNHLTKIKPKPFLEFKCRLCNEKVFNERYTFKDCKVVRCKTCGLIQVVGGNDTSRIYTESYFGHDKLCGPANTLEQRRRLRWLIRCGLIPGMSILDVGCATGEFLSAAVRYYNVRGIDISQFAIDRALLDYPKLRGKLKAGSLDKISFDVDKFDAIVMWDVIEHLQHPRNALHKLIKQLKPGGLICVSTPDSGAFFANILGRRWPFMTPPEHQCFFNINTLSCLMNDFGLVKTHHMNRGKWVNLRFLLYKIYRVFPEDRVKTLLQNMTLIIPKKMLVYAPSGDVLYCGFRRTI
jgi:2-polyprenyl-3-methyl-5-hydroxy-6-metoxy-1,4-benzoquinol methylase